ncbi:MAG TPA: hypothetical protein VK210_15810 [Terriglobia bacterium]|nr:hypothetical protein [Terriglobia bacterium]
MSQRMFASVATLAVLIVFVSLSPARMASQAKAPARTWVHPKTPWGDPDIQGMWPGTDLIGVPLARPNNFGERNTLTDEELAQKATQAQRTAATDSEEFVRPGTEAGINPPSYWLERGKPQRQASLVVDPPDGKIPALTAEAQKKQADLRTSKAGRGPNDSWEDHSLYDRCVSRGVMGSILPVIYNNGTQIVQGPGFVAIRYEMIHETRVIPLDGSPHASSKIRTYMGDARGHWEGNTLVVETTNFLGDKNGIGLNGGGTPHSDALRLVERFTRVDANSLNYEATINDAKTWTKPWTILMPLKLDPSYQLVEYACHEGNYALGDMLSGARAEEKAAADAAKKISK